MGTFALDITLQDIERNAIVAGIPAREINEFLDML
ncbi:hypothetical protein SAMN04490355_108315 [Pelosinus propionicus DSM 13327]|uniref:Uncharacterized protein n=1 Tax=Pelosinus propionicus DSM 13327 TaxID=1123291 RepID=A0A1I4Q4T1_9FIRM|nr:hypothetical protein SAMN04490355_108315 [Pelosinus propionicus DSM 13327]